MFLPRDFAGRPIATRITFRVCCVLRQTRVGPLPARCVQLLRCRLILGTGSMEQRGAEFRACWKQLLYNHRRISAQSPSSLTTCLTSSVPCTRHPSVRWQSHPKTLGAQALGCFVYSAVRREAPCPQALLVRDEKRQAGGMCLGFRAQG